jgi:hypothetical protein
MANLLIAVQVAVLILRLSRLPVSVCPSRNPDNIK